MFSKNYGIKGFIVSIILIMVIVGFSTCNNLLDDNKNKDNNNNNKGYDWYGNGSANTFTISDAAQLEELAKIARGTTGNGGPAQSNFKGKTIILSADINMSGKSWNGIYSSYGLGDLNGFNGIFDGNNQTISNLHANNQGFFGLIEKDGIVKNIIFMDLIVDGGDGGGGLTRVNKGKIQNISINGTVSGIPGGVTYSNSGIVEKCSFSGNIDGNSTGGGIANNNNNDGIIRNCFVTGNISGGGGIVAYNSGTIQDCYVIGDVNGFNATGGVVGNNSGMIKNCYTTGSITSGMSSAGGITGSNSDTVQNCVALNPSITGSMYVGRVCVSGNTKLKNNYCLEGMVMHGRYWQEYKSISDANGPHGADVSTTEVATQDWWITVINWDFINTWQWDSNKNLPILR